MPYQTLTHLLSLATVLGGVLTLVLFAAFFTRAFRRLGYFVGMHAKLIAFLVALSGIGGSMFYSEVVGFIPCILCWWQRSFLYPQAFILGFALWKKRRADDYVLLLSSIGALIALYHSYIQFGGISILPCEANGVSCAQRFFVEFGYVTIPTMSLTLFLLMIAVTLLGKKYRDEQ